MTGICVLIPAYKPDKELLNLIDELLLCEFCEIVVVNDGSGSEYDPIFAQLAGKATLLAHETNQGKGRALKTGFAYVKERGHEGVVTADADGQHRVADICKVAEALAQQKNKLVLGCRRFQGKVPFRSKLGNVCTRGVFLAGGIKVSDTQTGLRGIARDMLPWLLSLRGERYEYETRMLLEAKEQNYPFYEVPILTVYEKNNASSHFHPIRDSLTIYRQILAFMGSSLFCAAVDFVLLLALENLTGNLLLSAVGARAVSSLLNYTINRRLVFKKDSKNSFFTYYALVVVILGANYGLLELLRFLGLELALAKLLTEAILFAASYSVQRALIFTRKERKA